MFGIPEGFGLAALLIFFIMGLIGALIGRERGNSIGGFAISLILGPLGWLITCFLPVNKTYQCPYCGGIIVPGFQKCKNCGTLFKKV